MIRLAIVYEFESQFMISWKNQEKLLLRKMGTLKSCQIIYAFCKNDLKKVGYIVKIILGRNWIYYQIYVYEEK